MKIQWGPSIKAINHVNKYLSDTHRYPDSNGYDLRLKLAKSFNLDIKNVIIGLVEVKESCQ